MHRLNGSAPAYQQRVMRVEFQQFGLLNRQKGPHEGSNARLHRLLRLLQSLPTLLRQGPKNAANAAEWLRCHSASGHRAQIDQIPTQ
jgi:hypothetical protein